MKEFAVVYERTAENFSAYVPDLPGCIACGDTLEETEQLMKEAIELYIQTLKEDGRPVPEPQTRTGSLSVAI